MKIMKDSSNYVSNVNIIMWHPLKPTYITYICDFSVYKYYIIRQALLVGFMTFTHMSVNNVN